MRRWPLILSLTVLTSSLVTGCGAGLKKKAPGVPPTPETITQDRPGGDAHDPHQAALFRQKEADFGWRTDKDMQARFPLPDQGNWTRVRFSFIDHFTGFRYGKKHHSLSIAFVVKLEADDPRTSAACIERFEAYGRPMVADFGGEVSEIKTSIKRWKKQPLVVRRATGEVNFLFKHHEAALAWTGYPAYEDSCMIYAVAVPFKGHKKLAIKTRNRWVNSFGKFRPLTDTAPFRR